MGFLIIIFMSKLILNLAIDVSGNPKNEVYVGLVSIKTDKINKITSLFKKEFPRVYSGKHKGAKLKPSDLKKIIEFLDKNNVHMYSNCISKSDWGYFKKNYPNKSNFFERIYALAYFGLIHSFLFKNRTQNLVVCKENYLNIDATLRYFQYLAESNNYLIISSVGYAGSTFLIKLADLVASAHRKLDNKTLSSFKRYRVLKLGDLDNKFIERIFKK